MSADNAKGKRNKKDSSDILKIVRDFLEVTVGDLHDPELGGIKILEEMSDALTGSKTGFDTKYSGVVNYIYEQAEDLGYGLKRVYNSFILWYLGLIGYGIAKKPNIFTENVNGFMNLDVKEYVHFVMALPTWDKEWYIEDMDGFLKSF